MRIASRAAVVGCTAALLATVAASADEVVHFGPFAVDRAVLEGLAGRLEVRVVEGPEARLVAEGPAEAVGALVVDGSAGRLHVRAPQSGDSVTVVEQMTVVTGPGATSNVVIGSSAQSSATSGGAARPPLDLVLDLPRGSRLELLGFTGDALVGDLEGSVRIEAIGGTVRTGSLGAADFAAIGDGSIEAASVTGDLEASVTGAGRIVVLDGELGAVSVAVTGAGDVEIDAPAASAVVTMVGDGSVRLVEVASAPEVSRVGSGRFSTGPR
jgi:hypothetical protein